MRLSQSLSLLLMGFLVFVGAAWAADPVELIEKDFDRPGTAYTSITLPEKFTHERCMDFCAADPKCKAWTYKKPSKNPTCELKEVIYDRKEEKGKGTVSGVLQVGPMENVEWPVPDFKSFFLPDYYDEVRQVKFCRELCAIEGKCRAWTYVRPGMNGQNSICRLKGEIPKEGKVSTCCVSALR